MGLKKKKKKRKIGLGEFGFENIKCFPILKNGRNLVTNVENCFKIFEKNSLFSGSLPHFLLSLSLICPIVCLRTETTQVDWFPKVSIVSILRKGITFENVFQLDGCIFLSSFFMWFLLLTHLDKEYGRISREIF